MVSAPRAPRRMVSGCAKACSPSSNSLQNQAYDSASATDAPLSKALLLGITQFISKSSQGMDKLFLSWQIDFIANVFHIYVGDIGCCIGRHVPDFFEQCGSGNGVSC